MSPAAPMETPTERSIFLWDGPPPHSAKVDEFRPWLEPYLVEANRPRGAVIVCPGGGYGHRAPHEGTPVARRFNAAGLHAFVAQYRVAPHRHPAPILDAARAVRIVRSRAPEWGVEPERIAILGFSAGGHLACSVGVHFDEPCTQAGDALDEVSCRPNAMVLCYPVISSREFAHEGSIRNLLGPDAGEELWDWACLHEHVDARTPPTFLWHTAEDPGVPVENSLLFASRLSACKVPFELHVYAEGRHGLGLAPEDAHVATWADLAQEWLANMGW